ncbi:hypothetical protein SEPCBS57363_006548 [Sporothrix epigloea]|uniref:Protein kinase domain-containing protein n=1 Tax=Sporothrix epigloea TaxID=1892477 RepID=A0ABP0E3M2_9PEZI
MVSDVWQIACLLYQIQTGRRLFPTGVPVFEVLIGTIVDRLGPLPENWREKFKSNEYGYMSDGEVMFEEKNVWYWYEDSKSKETFDDRLAAGAPHLTPHQRKDFADLLLKMVAYEPEKRLPAAEVSLRLEGGLQSGGSVRQVGSLMPLSPQNINV